MATVVYFDPENWAKNVATVIQESIESILNGNGKCSILLTGGRTAEMVYKEWAKLPTFLTMEGASFYFGDERCVPMDSPLSNYSMVVRTLFAKKKDSLTSIFRIEGEDLFFAGAAKKYEDLLPIEIDVLLLTAGDDGHIASLFPNDQALFDRVNRVVPVVASKDPVNRITITPLAISQSKNIFVLAPGEEKVNILLSLLKNGVDIFKIPASLVLSGKWFVSSKLGLTK